MTGINLPVLLPEMQELGKVSFPFIWLGRNPLAIFVLMDALAILMIDYIIINEKRPAYAGLTVICDGVRGS